MSKEREEWQVEWFFEELETYIRAIITDATSDHVEDSVRLTELRKQLIERIMKGEFE